VEETIGSPLDREERNVSLSEGEVQEHPAVLGAEQKRRVESTKEKKKETLAPRKRKGKEESRRRKPKVDGEGRGRNTPRAWLKRRLLRESFLELRKVEGNNKI